MLLLKIISNIKNWKYYVLKPKTIKTTMTTTASLRKKARILSGTKVDIIEGENGPYARHSSSIISSASFFQMSYPILVKIQGMKKSPVYLFYKIIVNGLDGTLGDDSNVYCYCFHSAHKIYSIKK